MMAFCVCLSDSRDNLDSQLNQVGPTGGSVQTWILRFTMEMFIFKWLLLVIGETISRN